MNKIENCLFHLPQGMSKTDIQEHINSQLSMERDNNLKSIKKEVEEKLGGRYVSDGSDIYYLVAACSTHEDYYYVCFDKNNKIRFLTCVGKIELVKTLCPEGFEYFDSIIKGGNPEIVANIVKQTIENSETDVLFTKVIIEKTFY